MYQDEDLASQVFVRNTVYFTGFNTTKTSNALRFAFHKRIWSMALHAQSVSAKSVKDFLQRLKRRPVPPHSVIGQTQMLVSTKMYLSIRANFEARLNAISKIAEGNSVLLNSIPDISDVSVQRLLDPYYNTFAHDDELWTKRVTGEYMRAGPGQ